MAPGNSGIIRNIVIWSFQIMDKIIERPGITRTVLSLVGDLIRGIILIPALIAMLLVHVACVICSNEDDSR